MKESMSMRPIDPIAGPGNNSIVTPEAVALRVDVAEFGSRLGAYLIDQLIIAAVVAAFLLGAGLSGALGALSGLGHGLGVVLLGTALLALVWGYYPFFEAVWNGQTPGKRALGLRVVELDGQRAGLGAVLLRNLFRPVDGLGIGLLLVLLTHRHQRLGDLVAGTIVTRQAKVPQVAPVAFQIPPGAYLPPLDTTLLTEQEYGLIRSFLERRDKLDPGARYALGARLTAMVRAKVPGSDAYVWSDEILLEAVLLTVQRRSQEAAARPPIPNPPEGSPFPGSSL
jgi:uncharacterized RDD family membrane protein YckC